MANDRSEWKTYTLSALLSVVFALSGLAYSNVTSDIEDLKAERRETIENARMAAEKASALAVQVETLHGMMVDMSTQLDELNASQQLTVRRVDALVVVISSNTKAYRDALKQWNDEINRKRD